MELWQGIGVGFLSYPVLRLAYDLIRDTDEKHRRHKRWAEMFVMASRLRAMDMTEAAVEVDLKALRQRPDGFRVPFLLVEAHLWKQHETYPDTDALIEAYSQAATESPGNAIFLYRLSVLLRQAGRDADADSAYEQAKRHGTLQDDGTVI